MSTFRQSDSVSLWARSLAPRLPPGMRLDEHAHPWPQLVFAERGALAVLAVDRQWAVPPSRAMWVTANLPHEVETLSKVWLRTIEPLFLAETHLSFGQWRQQARLQHSIRRLAESIDVASVAAECGYESACAFVSMFRQALGVTLGKYLRHANIRTGTRDSEGELE